MNEQEISALSAEYPWFSYAHLSTLAFMKEDDPGYMELASKVSLHYPDPVLLEYLLQKIRNTRNVPEPMAEASPAASPLAETGPQQEPVRDAIEEPAEQPAEETPAIPKMTISEVPAGDLVFEPLHTTDYFASQGIKLSEEQQSSDRLGRQMKSFTAWLKTMKKVHTETVAPPEDIAVKIIAEKSNVDEEVITESMAEVYAGQGKIDKARDIYRKLSLINPAKSAYFAQKIDLLNN